MVQTVVFVPVCVKHRQQGAALIIALVILLLMTLIGVTAMQTTVLQERMAGNLRDRNIAFQAAEAALRDAERFLQAPVLPSFNNSNGLLQRVPQGGDVAYWNSFDWVGNSREFSGISEGLAAHPRYVIEEFPPVADPSGSLEADAPLPEVRLFRITARAVGGSPDAVVVLQTRYRRQ